MASRPAVKLSAGDVLDEPARERAQLVEGGEYSICCGRGVDPVFAAEGPGRDEGLVTQ
jgi:hypothetical protein